MTQLFLHPAIRTFLSHPRPPQAAARARTRAHGIRIAVCCALLLVLATSVPAQLNLLLEEDDVKRPEAPAPLKNLEADRAWVEANLADATAVLEDARTRLANAPVNLSEEEKNRLNDIVAIAEYRTLGNRQHLALLSEVKILREELAQLRKEEDSEPVLAESPPYSFGVALREWRALELEHGEEELDRLHVDMLIRRKSDTLTMLENSEQDYRRTLEKLEVAATEEERRVARQELVEGRLEKKFAEERIAYFRALEQVLSEQATRNQIRVRMQKAKLDTTLRGMKLGEEELKRRLEATDNEIAAVEKVLASISQEEEALRSQLDSARVRAAALPGTGADAETVDAEIRLLQERNRILRATVEEINTLHLVGLNLERGWWNRHHELDKTPDREVMRELEAWNAGYVRIAADAVRTIELTLEQLANREPLPVPASESGAKAHQALQDDVARREQLLRATLATMQRIHEFLSVWQAQLERMDASVSTAERVSESLHDLGNVLAKLWGYELFAIEDTLVVDGETIVEKRPVTVGKVFQAIAILAIGIIIAKGLGRLTGFLLAPLARRNWGIRLILEKVIRVGTIVATVTIALILVKIPLSVFAFLGGALAIGVGFGAQTLINNFISGFILLAERPIRPGDIIEIEGTRGRVENIGERCTRIRRFDGIEILIPNSQLLERSVTNITHTDQRMRASIQVGVAYGSPTRKVQDMLLQIAMEHALVLPEPAPVAQFERLGDSTLDFSVYFWIDVAVQSDWRLVASDLLHRICERMAEEQITIAFPQRDIHFDVTRPIPVEVIRPSNAENADT